MRQLESRSRASERKFEEEAVEYERTVEKMQKDMMLIKTSWERRCSEVEEQLR